MFQNMSLPPCTEKYWGIFPGFRREEAEEIAHHHLGEPFWRQWAIHGYVLLQQYITVSKYGVSYFSTLWMTDRHQVIYMEVKRCTHGLQGLYSHYATCSPQPQCVNLLLFSASLPHLSMTVLGTGGCIFPVPKNLLGLVQKQPKSLPSGIQNKTQETTENREGQKPPI